MVMVSVMSVLVAKAMVGVIDLLIILARATNMVVEVAVVRGLGHDQKCDLEESCREIRTCIVGTHWQSQSSDNLQ